jgi:hypothetical protein
VKPRSDTLTSTYDALWSRGREALRFQASAEVPLLDPLPVEGGLRWGISAVFRPRAWSAALQRCAAELAKLMGPEHFVYGPDSMHVTLRQFEGYRAEVRRDDAQLRMYGDALFTFASRQAPVKIDLRGLTASPAGAIVQGWPITDLDDMRSDLHRQLEASGAPLLGPEKERSDLRRTAHASLSIYGGPVADTSALMGFIDAHRATPFGEQCFDRVWLVGYRRTRASVELIEYASFPLCGASS